MSARPWLAAAGLALAAASLAGCSASSGGSARASSGTPAVPSVASSPAAPSMSSAPSVPLTSTPARTTTPRPSTSAPSATHRPVTVRAPISVAPRSTCGAVTVRIIRGSADRGREIAALQFTNDGSSRCTLNGFPTVTLYRNGQRIGSASQPETQGTSSYELAPGATAESRLDDFTDCQAPLSDSIHLVVPGSTQRYHRPGEMRACTLRVTKLGKPE